MEVGSWKLVTAKYAKYAETDLTTDFFVLGSAAASAALVGALADRIC
jgi:hypothetical protein